MEEKKEEEEPPPSLLSSHLVHDEDEQGQQQQPGQNRQSHNPSGDGPGRLADPDHRQADGGAVGLQLRREVLVGHLDHAEGGGGAHQVGAVLVLLLQDAQTSSPGGT